jgi:hypothetical protein
MMESFRRIHSLHPHTIEYSAIPFTYWLKTAAALPLVFAFGGFFFE